MPMRFVVASIAASAVDSDTPSGRLNATEVDTDVPVWRHAISLTGPPKYPPEFKRTDYVNPAAPKGGRVRIGALGTFDNFNP